MSLAKLQRFIQYLRTNNVMSQEDVLRAVRQMSVFDRRIGQLGAFRGFLQPDQINTILLEQTRTGVQFGECAVRINLLTSQQVGMLVRLQKDDLFLFAQASVVQKLTTTERVIGHIKSFLGANPDMAKEAEQEPSQEKVSLDREIRSVLKSIEEVSPLPASAQRAALMLEDPKVSLDKVGEVLSLDPGLTSTLLRVVNSAFYGLRDKITSVTKALVVLGIKKLRQLVVAAAVMQKFQSVPPKFAQAFWENAVRTAQWSKELGEHRKMAEIDELFICGLLHNIGHILSMQYFRAHQNKIDEMVAQGKKLLDAEKSVLGGTHADIGGFLFNLWQMPKPTVQSAMYHHHDFNLVLNMPNLTDEVLIIHMAAAICEIDPNLDAFGYSEKLEAIGKKYRGPLKLGENVNMDKLAERVDATYAQMIATFTGR